MLMRFTDLDSCCYGGNHSTMVSVNKQSFTVTFEIFGHFSVRQHICKERMQPIWTQLQMTLVTYIDREFQCETTYLQRM